RMVSIGVSARASDACGAASLVLASITSNEPDDAAGLDDGNIPGDIQDASPGEADFDFQLRAERDGGGEGRVYRVTYSAVDGSGNRSDASSLVFVPHDQGGGSEPLLLSVEDGSAGTILKWESVPGASSYKVIRGMVVNLREAGDFIDLGPVAC